MSHFTVGVITKHGSKAEVEKLLAPFNESLEVEHFISRETIIKEKREEIQEYKEGLYATYIKDPEAYAKGVTNQGHLDYLENTFPKEMAMNDDEIYALATKFYDEDQFMENGSIRSLYNPDSKWDWWEIGGRWDKTVPTIGGTYVNTALIKFIDFSPTEKDIAHYSEIWDAVVEGKEHDEIALRFAPDKKSLLERYGTKENYIEEEGGFSTYATLIPITATPNGAPKGEWIEPGAMGWFGTSSQTDESKRLYDDRVKSTMDIYKDYYLTIVDCHI